MVQKKYCSKDSLSEWLDQHLCQALGLSSANEIVSYVFSMDTLECQTDYLKGILDAEGEFRDRMDIVNEFSSRSNKPVAYKKPPLRESPSKKSPSPQKGSERSGSKGTPKGKYINFYGDPEADSFLLSGRHLCECQATKHKLINNCVKCGRIVCEQEGSGPCMKCSALVCTKEEMSIVSRGSRKSEQLMKKLMGAEAHKNKLLEFDRTCEKRTQVIDDENDYFSSDGNQWLSSEQRAALQKREAVIRESKYGSRLNRKVTIDLAGRQVLNVNEFSGYDASQDAVVKSIYDKKKEQKTPTHSSLEIPHQLLNPTIDRPRPEYIAKDKKSSSKEKRKLLSPNENTRRRANVNQDKELQIMSDSGNCLTMHQPWASYLVAGIKLDEGRSWYSHHRGRLWIHAAAKVPDPQGVEALKDFYRAHYKKPDLKFPTDLPTSCLLGSVDIIDVLPQEDYRERFPNGESLSPFVFIADNPQELKYKTPMSGQHKIYKLDPDVHNAATKALKHGPLNPHLSSSS
eukprot:TRINITY_DN10680_c0_g1_i1.p1 TRINITY_DN10680_c0_g1~~TRINITY_DN10680_c0_g1_i1.p1  ORF type:complete len:521 (+),score=108.37 TRINITY_DN10680_c0_g1_i1:23-1564(+)